jgi:hypothetical protein
MSLGVDSGAGPVRSEGMQSARSHLNLELLEGWMLQPVLTGLRDEP